MKGKTISDLGMPDRINVLVKTELTIRIGSPGGREELKKINVAPDRTIGNVVNETFPSTNIPDTATITTNDAGDTGYTYKNWKNNTIFSLSNPSSISIRLPYVRELIVNLLLVSQRGVVSRSPSIQPQDTLSAVLDSAYDEVALTDGATIIINREGSIIKSTTWSEVKDNTIADLNIRNGDTIRIIRVAEPISPINVSSTNDAFQATGLNFINAVFGKLPTTVDEIEEFRYIAKNFRENLNINRVKHNLDQIIEHGYIKEEYDEASYSSDSDFAEEY